LRAVSVWRKLVVFPLFVNQNEAEQIDGNRSDFGVRFERLVNIGTTSTSDYRCTTKLLEKSPATIRRYDVERGARLLVRRRATAGLNARGSVQDAWSCDERLPPNRSDRHPGARPPMWSLRMCGGDDPIACEARSPDLASLCAAEFCPTAGQWFGGQTNRLLLGDRISTPLGEAAVGPGWMGPKFVSLGHRRHAEA
jgi:hypothetical protein